MKKAVNLWTIITFVLGLLLGSGAIWQFLDYRLDREKHKLEEIQATAQIRKDIYDLQMEIIDLSAAYIKNKDHNTGIRLGNQLENKINDLITLEAKLAQVENRDPRYIQTDFIPPAAINDLEAF